MDPKKKIKPKCRWCNKSRPPMKFYIIADDMENPRPYHQKCKDAMFYEAMMQMALDKNP